MHFLSKVPRARLKGLRVLLRIDANIESETESFRLDAILPTIRFLLSCGARVILMSHRGRPEGGEKKLTLRPAAHALGVRLKKRITFIPDLDFPSIQRKITASRSPIVLLENLRFYPGEQKGDLGLAKKLASLGDIYVNDAFSVSHRSEASIVALARLLPAYAGLLFEKEIANLSRALRNVKRPFVVVVGGAKIPEKLHFIEALRSRANAILVGGVIANTILKAGGMDIKKSVYDSAYLSRAKKLLSSPALILPIDFLSEKGKFLDIGPLTAARFELHIRNARTIIWNGPMGLFEKKRFSSGTDAVARAIAKSRAFSIAGGGETSQYIQSRGYAKRVSFLSTGGGAMLEYLINKTLPGIQALEKASR